MQLFLPLFAAAAAEDQDAEGIEESLHLHVNQYKCRGVRGAERNSLPRYPFFSFPLSVGTGEKRQTVTPAEREEGHRRRKGYGTHAHQWTAALRMP